MPNLSHILVVEHDPLVRHGYTEGLMRAGYRVSSVAGGEETLVYLRLVIPDLILIGSSLPGMSPDELAHRIRADRTHDSLPLIMITARGDWRVDSRSLDIGIDDLIGEPVDMAELLLRIRATQRLQRARCDVQRMQQRMLLLLRLTQELGVSVELDGLLTRLLATLADTMGAIRASLILTDAADQERPSCYSSSHHTTTGGLAAILRRGVAGWVLRERLPAVIADTRNDSRWFCAESHHFNVRAVAAVPLLHGNTTLGVVTLVHHTPGFFTEEHVDLLSMFVRQIIVQAIEKAHRTRVAIDEHVRLIMQRERERTHAILRRYLSPQVAAQILSVEARSRPPVECQVAVIFADLRDFTSLTERMDPRVVVEQILNRYFAVLTDVLCAHDGTVEKFLGDGLIGVFGTPIAYPDDAQRALEAAVAMQQAMATLADGWRAELGCTIGMGVGLSYGPALIAQVGSEQRQDYTLIGDVVNTAARLSKVARAGQVIISQQLVDALPRDYQPSWPLHPCEPVVLKGKEQPLPIVTVDVQ
jgi:class 3 adenylate cyclase/DNA-binding response OmpR family regulator